MKIYVLSHDGTLVIDNQRVNTYRWVNVSGHQVKAGMTSTPVIPEDKAGSVVHYGIEGKKLTLRVMGNGLLRELSDDEEETIQTIQIPRI